MTASASVQPAPAGGEPPLRFVTAASLFDGHDAAINVMRRVLQAEGAEVVHLGHDRSVEDVVTAALQEDADGIAVSSYQGGHMEFFSYLLERLRARGGAHVRVYGGGGGVISAEEIATLHERGVARIFSPDDGRALGLQGMIRWICADCAAARARRAAEAAAHDVADLAAPDLAAPHGRDDAAVARAISAFESSAMDPAARARAHARLADLRPRAPAPVVGFTGTGGAGKSTLVDEVLRRYRARRPGARVGVLLVDPSRRRSGGALLGDRLRLNAIDAEHVFVRSLATRRAHRALSGAVADAVRVLQAADFDWIIVETAGIGQSDSEVVDLVDLSVYVMTPEYGAPSQLEKIDMIDLADLLVLNKFDRRGAEDALRDVRKQWRRNRADFAGDEAGIPVFGTMASRFCDPGTDRFFEALMAPLAERLGLREAEIARSPRAPAGARIDDAIVPERRVRYLSEIADTVRRHRAEVERAADAGRDAQAFARALEAVGRAPGAAAEPLGAGEIEAWPESVRELGVRYDAALDAIGPERLAALRDWPATRAAYGAPSHTYRVREREIEVANHAETLYGLRVPKVALPATDDWGELVRYLGLENLPGRFPYTAGVFPFKRSSEEGPTRMFAGEGPPERTNRRFHLLVAGHPAARLSTAFDSVTLYGRDPDERPDVWGKVGTSGVSVCTVDDAKKLYSGIDLLAPSTSVSMTINGPAPILLAFYFNAAIDRAVERHLHERGELEARVAAFWEGCGDRPRYAGPLPDGHDGGGLATLGIAGDALVDAETYARIRADVLRRIRGTVQADILKEDQAQNTCIFSTEFSLRLMGDVQEYFCANDVSSFYSVSISGYHIAEAGAYPITQLAFTLANAFTYCEYYLARGLAIDDFAPNLSFFFSNGLDPEYAVIGRVARRIWAVALRDVYGANERSQKLKYHIQTSGRSLHAQEMAFNDIRTTLQAYLALADHCNSLHTNAYDEAVTTPTEESVRRAVAIQLILDREFGVLSNENPHQGAYLTRELTDLVEEAVLAEFERISDRGGVLGAMETMYQRGRIQDESLRYEAKKHSGELPIVGVNQFESPHADAPSAPRELVRSTEEERAAQLGALRAFQARHAAACPEALARLERAALDGRNVFAELMETVKVASLGQISETLFRVGGQYRRSM